MRVSTTGMGYKDQRWTKVLAWSLICISLLACNKISQKLHTPRVAIDVRQYENGETQLFELSELQQTLRWQLKGDGGAFISVCLAGSTPSFATGRIGAVIDSKINPIGETLLHLPPGKYYLILTTLPGAESYTSPGVEGVQRVLSNADHSREIHATVIDGK